MPALLWLTKYWKEIAIAAIVAALAGTFLFMRAEISNLKGKNKVLESNQAVLTGDLEAAKTGIDKMNASMKQYKKWVADSFSAAARSNSMIADENRKLQASLDNITGPATAARRIIDAPLIPFFTTDVGAAGRGMRPAGDNAYRRSELPAGDPRGAPGP